MFLHQQCLKHDKPDDHECDDGDGKDDDKKCDDDDAVSYKDVIMNNYPITTTQ